MKHWLILPLLLFLVACDTESVPPAPAPAPEVEMPVTETPEPETPVVEDPELEESIDTVDETTDEPETTTADEEVEDPEPETPVMDETPDEDDSGVFTAATLAYYDGKEGRPAYVAVNGVVYDLTDSDYWRNGNHYGGFTAGRDLTAQFANQHGDSRLSRFPIVGSYVN